MAVGVAFPAGMVGRIARAYGRAAVSISCVSHGAADGDVIPRKGTGGDVITVVSSKSCILDNSAGC